MNSRPISRRSVLKQMLMGCTALALSGPALAREYGRGMGMPWEPGLADQPYYGTEPQRFLTEPEREAVDAISARFIPSDETGPGAREADVVGFIDRQLAGFYGRGQHWYMRGPFPEPLETQGYQQGYTPRAFVRHGLAALDAHCRDAHGGLAFAELGEEEQDAVLTGLEEEEIEFEDVSAKAFFDFVHEMTIEGFFCDPVYGGNRDMVGWQFVGFPGARYDYRDFIHHDGAAIEMPPVSLIGRPEWNSAR